MTPNWVIVKLHLPRLSRDGMSPSLCGGTGKRKSTSVKFAILALTAKLAQTVPIAPRKSQKHASRAGNYEDPIILALPERRDETGGDTQSYT
jgi:hypothetical protein